MSDAFFRANVGACVTDDLGRVLALKRKGVPESAWQMPQGGIEEGETPHDAVVRELQEETGLRARDFELVTERPGWLVYELPLEFRRPKVGWGQAQRWFLLRMRPGATIRADGEEFEAFEWLHPAELLSRAIAFRRPVYEQVFSAFDAHLRA
jgi:putative (di)nucleoside polyphosphate hydrolase